MIRVLLYGDIDLNLIDGSAIWLASLAEMLGGDPDVSVSVLQKTPLVRTVVTHSAAALTNVRFLDPWAMAAVNEEVHADLLGCPADKLSPQAAAALITRLVREADFNIVLVRSIDVAARLIHTPDLARRLWVYVTNPACYQTADERLRLLQIARCCGTIVCQTDEAKSALITLLQLESADQVVVVPPMIPLLSAAGAFALDPAAPRLGYSGKFSPPYRILEMLTAFETIRQKLPGAEFHVLGDKFHNVPPVTGFVEEVKRRLTSTPGVVWYGGVSRAEATKVLEQVNIASSWRTPAFDDSLELSTKILEYSALAIPVLMNPSPIHLRVFGRDYPGYVTTHSDFVERVLSLASSPHLYEGASRGVHSIASSFTYASHRQRLLPLLRSARPRVESKDRTRTILWAGHDFKFLRSIRELVEREGPYRGLTDQLDGHVVRNPQRSQELLREADVIFCEWCLGNAEWYSQHKLAGQLLVVRLHRQEIDLPYLQRIEWDNVDRLVFINGWVMDRFLLQFPSMRQRTVLIHNAIDCRSLGLDKLFGAEFNLGLLGYCPKLKAPHLALDILAQLKELDRRYTLFIKGRSPRDYDWLWKRPEERNYYEDLDARLEQFPHANSVVFEPHSDDVPTWLSKIGFILSTSDIEGSHQAVAEGMASGAIPVIRNWAGAEELYPSKYVFSKTHEAAHLVDMWHSSEHYSAEVFACRELAHSFDLTVIVREYLDLLAALVAEPTPCTHGITRAISEHREAGPRRQPVPITM